MIWASSEGHYGYDNFYHLGQPIGSDALEGRCEYSDLSQFGQHIGGEGQDFSSTPGGARKDIHNFEILRGIWKIPAHYAIFLAVNRQLTLNKLIRHTVPNIATSK